MFDTTTLLELRLESKRPIAESLERTGSIPRSKIKEADVLLRRTQVLTMANAEIKKPCPTTPQTETKNNVTLHIGDDLLKISTDEYSDIVKELKRQGYLSEDHKRVNMQLFKDAHMFNQVRADSGLLERSSANSEGFGDYSDPDDDFLSCR